MIITTFYGTRPQGKAHEIEWDELVDSMSTHIETNEKEKCTGFSMAAFKDDYRKNLNVEEIWGLVFDFDGQPIKDVLMMLDGLKYFYYSTFSHPHPDKGDCWRLVLPFDYPVTPLEYERIWKHMFYEVSGLADPSCKDPSRFFFKPSCQPDKKEFVFFGEGKGEFLNVEEIINQPDDIHIEIYDEKNITPLEKTVIAPTKQDNTLWDYNSLDIQAFFSAKSLYIKPKHNDRYEDATFIECPWKGEHTDGKQGETDTYVWRQDDHVFFNCSHSHCSQRNITHVIDMYPDYGDYCREVYYEHSQPSKVREVEKSGVPQSGNIEEIQIKALGIDYNGKFVYQSSKTNLVTMLTAGAHQRTGLTGVVAEHAYWIKHYPTDPDKNGKVKVSWERAGESLMKLCQDVGRYEPHDIRGVGLWKDGDDIIFNSGKYLYVNGVVTEYFGYNGNFHYEPVANHIELTRPLDKTESLKIQDIVKRLPIKNNLEKTLFLGAIALGGFSGVLEWRPHIWLLGTSGSGKSTTLQKVISPLWRPLNGLFFEGGSTESGIRQNIRRNAVPIMVDEMKADGKKELEQMSNLLSLIRSSSANTSAMIAKGTSSQDMAANFKVKSMFVLASVDHYLEHEQDFERFTRINFVQNPGSKKDWANLEMEIEELFNEEFALSLFSRTYYNLPTILKNIKTIKYSIIKNTNYNARFADQVSSLLAGAFSLASDDELTSESAYSYFCSFTGWDSLVIEKENTVQSIYTNLLSSFVYNSNERITISRLIERFVDQFETSGKKPNQGTLTELGLKLDFKKKTLLIANKQHPNTKKLFKEMGIVDYQEALLKLPGAKKTNTQYYSTGMQMRSTEVPLAVLRADLSYSEQEKVCA